jgi:ActR/RegA family two-component response regulator
MARFHWRNMNPLGILLSDDLIFASRITGTARAQALEMKTARTVEQVRQMASAGPPACVIVDLHHPGLELAAFIRDIKNGGPCTIVGYGSHVAAELLQQARVAGCDVVLPRSKFVEELAESLPRWYGKSVQS